MDVSQIWIPLLLTFLAGISTAFGSCLVFCIKKFKKSYLCFSLGLSAGIMIYISFVELLPEAIEAGGFFLGNVVFFAGVLFIMVIDFLVPHEYIAEHMKVKKNHKRIVSAGVFTAIGIAIHNFPEGIAVFMSSFSDLSLGIPLAFAIALHNIPEGISIAVPIYYSTKSRSKAFWYSFASGLAEPLGALVCILFLMPYLTTEFVSLSLGFVAGIMVFISFDELLPIAYTKENAHLAVAGVFLGMVVMALSLLVL
jgi:zinc transporter, ZIP family